MAEKATERLEGTTANTGAPALEDQLNSIGFGLFQWRLLIILGLLVVADGMELVRSFLPSCMITPLTCSNHLLVIFGLLVVVSGM